MCTCTQCAVAIGTRVDVIQIFCLPYCFAVCILALIDFAYRIGLVMMRVQEGSILGVTKFTVACAAWILAVTFQPSHRVPCVQDSMYIVCKCKPSTAEFCRSAAWHRPCSCMTHIMMCLTAASVSRHKLLQHQAVAVQLLRLSEQAVQSSIRSQKGASIFLQKVCGMQ